MDIAKVKLHVSSQQDGTPKTDSGRLEWDYDGPAIRFTGKTRRFDRDGRDPELWGASILTDRSVRVLWATAKGGWIRRRFYFSSKAKREALAAFCQHHGAGKLIAAQRTAGKKVTTPAKKQQRQARSTRAKRKK